MNASDWQTAIPSAERYVEMVVLAVIALTSAGGNIWLWLVVLTTKSLRVETNNLLLLSLALADILVSVVSMPVTLVTMYKARWVFSDDTCKSTGFLNMLTLVCSVMSLCLVTVNRYIKICRPEYYKGVYTNVNVVCMALGAWCLSGLMASPPLYGWCEFVYRPRQSFCFCDWFQSPSYAFFMMMACFSIPLSMMVVCNIRILQTFRNSQRRLKQFSKEDKAKKGKSKAKKDGKKKTAWGVKSSAVEPTKPEKEMDSVSLSQVAKLEMKKQAEAGGEDGMKQSGAVEAGRAGGVPSDVQQKKDKRRMEEFQIAVSLMVVIAVFLLCWIPLSVTVNLSIFAPDSLTRSADMFSLLFGYSSSCINPIIYGLMNKRVKEGYKALWKKICPRCLSCSQDKN